MRLASRMKAFINLFKKKHAKKPKDAKKSRGESEMTIKKPFSFKSKPIPSTVNDNNDSVSNALSQPVGRLHKKISENKSELEKAKIHQNDIITSKENFPKSFNEPQKNGDNKFIEKTLVKDSEENEIYMKHISCKDKNDSISANENNLITDNYSSPNKFKNDKRLKIVPGDRSSVSEEEAKILKLFEHLGKEESQSVANTIYSKTLEIRELTRKYNSALKEVEAIKMLKGKIDNLELKVENDDVIKKNLLNEISYLQKQLNIRSKCDKEALLNRTSHN